MKYLKYVNVKQGTKSNPRYSNGNTLPLTQVPFGMLALAPQSDGGERGAENAWWYDPEARYCEGIRLTHQPSPWIGDYGALLITPQSDVVSDTAAEAWSGIRPEDCELSPDYIRMKFLRSNATAEATAAERCFGMRIQFDTYCDKYISLFNICGKMEIKIDEEKNCIYGMTNGFTSGKAENFGMYFVIIPKGEWLDYAGSRTVYGDNGSEALHLAVKKDCNSAEFDAAISYISYEQALINYAEIKGKDFDTIRNECATKWESFLSKIEIDTDSVEDKRTFYSCLYRCGLFPHKAYENRSDGTPVHYSPYTGKVHKGKRYTDNGFWDTYRTEFPLKTLTITPVSGITSDAVYSVTVTSGFGPSEVSYTTADYNNKFKVTIYANEKFDNGAISDGSAVKVVGGNSDFKDGGVVFRDATIGVDSTALANAENYTVKFDYKLYTASMNTEGKNYDSAVPYSSLWYNASGLSNSTPLTGYSWTIENDGVVPTVSVNGAATENTKENFAENETKFGDAYLEDDGSITLFKEGYNFVDNDYIFYDANGEIVLDSLRSAKLYEYELDKTGKGASLLRDGNKVSSFAGTESNNVTASTGYFGLRAQLTEFIWVDNLQAYSFEEMTGIVSKLDMTNNKVIIENYDEQAANVVIVVAAYNSNNKMLESYMPDVTTVQSGTTEVPVVFSNADGAVTYKAFV